MEKTIKERKQEEKKTRLALEGPREETDEDEKLDKELEETIKKIERDKKRQTKKDRVQTAKSDLRTKMSVIATTTVDNDEELYMPQKMWETFRKKVDDKPDEKSGSEEENESDGSEESQLESDSDENEHKGVKEDSDAESVDSGIDNVNQMADEFEEQIAQ